MNHLVISSMDDFSKMCRCCATLSDELTPLLQCGNTDENIPKMFKECFNLEVSSLAVQTYRYCCYPQLHNFRLTAPIYCQFQYVLLATKNSEIRCNSKSCVSHHLRFSQSSWKNRTLRSSKMRISMTMLTTLLHVS